MSIPIKPISASIERAVLLVPNNAIIDTGLAYQLFIDIVKTDLLNTNPAFLEIFNLFHYWVLLNPHGGKLWD